MPLPATAHPPADRRTPPVAAAPQALANAPPPSKGATLLHASDDVATAHTDLVAGSIVQLSCGATTRSVELVDDIRSGHKFAVRDLAAGLRIRKYGEFIGRVTADVAAGASVHVQNLETGARRARGDAAAWCEQSDAPGGVRHLGSHRATVGESPVYDAESNGLYWVDVRGTPAIHRIDIDSGDERSWPMDEDIGSIALASRGTLIAGLRSGFAFFDPASGALSPIVDPEADLPANRLNDGKCDAAGRFWCGSMNPDSGRAEGSLYVLDVNLDCRRVLAHFLTPNGLAWSPDGHTMYAADTRRGFIYAFDFDVAAGTLSQRRVFADLGALAGGPDGAAVDCEGHLWSAIWDGGCLIRFDPRGRMDRVIRLPVSKPTSCAFGGPGYRRLFVTTATRGLDADRLRNEPMAGRVLQLDVGVAGLAPARFDHRGGAGTPR